MAYLLRYRKGQNAYPEHIVNLMQGLKTPPLMYLVSGDAAHKNGYSAAFAEDGWLWKQCGRIDGMVSGTEPITDRSTTAGTELCAIVERILSSSVAIKILGDASIGDQMERVAYNALPASLAYDMQGLAILHSAQPTQMHQRAAWVPAQRRRSEIHLPWPSFRLWLLSKQLPLRVAQVRS